MKQILTLGVLTAVLGLFSAGPAAAWCKFNFGFGVNLGYEGGNNSLLFGLWKGGPGPGQGGCGVPGYPGFAQAPGMAGPNGPTGYAGMPGMDPASGYAPGYAPGQVFYGPMAPRTDGGKMSYAEPEAMPRMGQQTQQIAYTAEQQQYVPYTTGWTWVYPVYAPNYPMVIWYGQ